MIFLSFCLLISGCGQEPIIGEIDQNADVALLCFESFENGISGVVYRRIQNFDAFIGASEVPVLVAFYDPDDPVNSLVIPTLEQMADDGQGLLQIVWINAKTQTTIAENFSVTRLPQFTVVVGAVLKRSLVGFDDQGQKRLEELIQPYL